MFALNEKDEKPKILLSVHIYFHIYTKRFSHRSQSKKRVDEGERVTQEDWKKSQALASICNLKHICELQNSILLQTI